MADWDPSGFTLCLAGNGADAFVYPEVLVCVCMQLGSALAHHRFGGDFGYLRGGGAGGAG